MDGYIKPTSDIFIKFLFDREECNHILLDFIKDDSFLSDARNHYQLFIKDENMRDLYNSRLKFKRDLASDTLSLIRSCTDESILMPL